MSGVDQGMMPEYVEPQPPDDDSVDERVADSDAAAPDDETEIEQAEVDDALAGIGDDERSDMG